MVLGVALALLVWCTAWAPAAALPVPTDDSPWQWPLLDRSQSAPRLVRGFDPPPQPWLAGHRGVDLAGVAGQRVLAPAAGRVTFAGRVAGRGVVTIEVGGERTTLEPVTPTVRTGTEVRAGQRVGVLQPTGGHCLPRACLHWGLREGLTDAAAYLDPLARLGLGPRGSADVVLLPIGGRPDGGSWTDLAGVLASAAWIDGAGRRGGQAAGGAGRAISFALQQLGEPYVWAAAGPDAWDCSGLTQQAWAAAGRRLPHYSAAQYTAATPVGEGDLAAGDLVFWSVDPHDPRTIFHVGLYLGGGQMVHAPRPGTAVRVESIYSWARPDFFGRV